MNVLEVLHVFRNHDHVFSNGGATNVSWLVQKFVPEFISAALHMAGIADCLVDVLNWYEMLIVPHPCEVICRIFLLSLLLGDGGAQGVTQPLDEGELHLVTGILDEVPVIVGFLFQY